MGSLPPCAPDSYLPLQLGFAQAVASGGIILAGLTLASSWSKVHDDPHPRKATILLAGAAAAAALGFEVGLVKAHHTADSAMLLSISLMFACIAGGGAIWLQREMIGKDGVLRSVAGAVLATGLINAVGTLNAQIGTNQRIWGNVPISRWLPADSRPAITIWACMAGAQIITGLRGGLLTCASTLRRRSSFALAAAGCAPIILACVIGSRAPQQNCV